MYHGLSVYNRIKGIVSFDSQERFVNAQSAFISYSDKPLGYIGLFADVEHANVRFACECDCHSSVGFDSDEYEPNWRYSDIMSDVINEYPEEGKLSYDMFKKYSERSDSNHKRGRRRYAEFIAKAETDAIWCKRNAPRKWFLVAKKLAIKNNLPLLFV